MKILIADDEPLIIDLLTEYLTAAGHDVTSAYDGKSLIKMVEEDPPELVFLDINMPGMRDEILSPRVEIPPALKNIPVVAVTGTDREKLYKMGLPAHIEVIQKPINFPEVDAAIAKLSGSV